VKVRICTLGLAMGNKERHTGSIVIAMAVLAFASMLMSVDVVAQATSKPAAAGKQTRSETSTTAGKPVPLAQTQKPLDLRVPDVSELFTPEQIQAILSHTASDDYEEVEVRGTRIPATPDVWGGLGAPVWGLLNPTQAWRIIAPIPPDQIHAADVRPEAQPQERDPFRP
jgi:hypothetical protein